MHSRKIGLLRQTPYLQIPELHDHLTDTADWDAAEGFLFSATWDPPQVEERDIGRDELLAVVDSNSISTSTVYRVEPTTG